MQGTEHETTRAPWPVWSAVWVGALSAVALGLIIGLLGYAVGAHEMTGPRIASWKHVRLVTAAFDIAGAFFAFVLGGWVAARLAGFRRAEPAMLQGVTAWLLTIPALLLFGSLGATAHFGGWYGALAGTPAWVTPPAVTPDAAAAIRNTAVATLVALLLGLVGSVIGGWMASGEPMSLTYYRRRTIATTDRRRAA